MSVTTRVAATSAAALIAAVLQGCSSLPERIETLEQARTSMLSLRQEPLAREVAGAELERAEQNLERAEIAYEEREPLEVVEHSAYVALRNAQAAEQIVAAEKARVEIEQGEALRARLELEAREREAQRRQAEIEEARALAEQRLAELERQAQAAELERQRAAELEAQLADLQARETERGLVLTLDDVLFDTGRATLKAGASSTVERLSQFLADNPERRILIEGHTDSVGEEAYNLELSAQRAEALRDALVERGTAIERVQTSGLGEAYPLASNDTAAGRQLNRRVEIVISDQNGAFPVAAQRVAL